MKKNYFKAALLSVALFGGVSVAQAQVLTFDDYPTTLTPGVAGAGQGSKSLGNYDGYTFTNTKIFNERYLASGLSNTSRGYYNGVVASTNTHANAIFNATDAELSFTSQTTGAKFNFESAFITAASRDNLKLTVTGWVNGSPIVTHDYSINASYGLTAGSSEGLALRDPSINGLYALNFGNTFDGVDKVTFSAAVVTDVNGNPLSPVHAGYSSSSKQFVIDDISVSPVPEAEEWAMMMLGLGVIGAVARRKKAA